MKGVLLGCPGAGKGTQAQKICQIFNIPQISTGDMLRGEISSDTELGKTASNYMNKGNLVPDDIIINIVRKRISQSDCENGFLLDGFPRSFQQAQALRDSGVLLDFVLEIKVPDDEAISRLTGRRVHLKSGRSYHIKFNPPKVAEIDDITGEPLVQRDDDCEEAIENRLKIYHKQISSLKPFYNVDEQHAKYIVIDGIGSMDSIFMNIKNEIQKLNII